MIQKSRSKQIRALFLGGVLPVIVFAVIEDRFGTMWGLVAGMIFGVGEIVWEWRTQKKVDTITWAGNGTTRQSSRPLRSDPFRISLGRFHLTFLIFFPPLPSSLLFFVAISPLRLLFSYTRFQGRQCQHLPSFPTARRRM